MSGTALHDDDFHYGVKSSLPLANYEAVELVVYVGSLSKLIAPTVRIGLTIQGVSIIDTNRF